MSKTALDLNNSEMEPYAGFQPTGFDPKGLAAERMGFDEDDSDRSTWLVVPVGLNRDSLILARSNWEAATAELERADTDGSDWETHRFGHWGCGWFEILIVRPESAAHSAALSIEAALASYPILDEDAHSDLAAEQADEDWENWAASDFRSELERRYCGALEVDLWGVDSDDLRNLAREWDILSNDDEGLGFYGWGWFKQSAPLEQVILTLRGAEIEGRTIGIRTNQDGERFPILSRRQAAQFRRDNR